MSTNFFHTLCNLYYEQSRWSILPTPTAIFVPTVFFQHNIITLYPKYLLTCTLGIKQFL